MNKFYFLCLVLIGQWFVLSSCHRKKIAKCDSLKSYIYTDATEERVYSMKLTCDTVFLTEYLPKQKSYFALYKNDRKIKIDSLIEKINFSNLKEVYFESTLEDRHVFKIIIQNGKKIDSTFIYGKDAPSDISKISTELQNLVRSLQFSLYDKDVDYGKHTVRFPPPPKSPSKQQTANDSIFFTWN
ncbi:MAG: hypothetical protein ACOH1O_05415 [Flavobacterium sp.]